MLFHVQHHACIVEMMNFNNAGMMLLASVVA